MEQANQSKPALGLLLGVYLKTGNLTFGGGDPTMAVLQRDLCERRGWMTREQYALAFSLARITPGTNILAFCAASARMLHGSLASVAAVIAASGPSAVLSVCLGIFFGSSGANPVAQAAVGGVLAAVVGMMGSAAVSLVKPHLHTAWAKVIVICAGTVALRVVWNLGPVQVLVLAVLLDAVWKEPA